MSTSYEKSSRFYHRYWEDTQSFVNQRPDKTTLGNNSKLPFSVKQSLGQSLNMSYWIGQTQHEHLECPVLTCTI